MYNKSVSTISFLGFLVASIATLGSLFFSEFMEFIPCTMCWYQRIFMYPLVLIFLMNLLETDSSVFKYATPLALVGFGFSLYHNLLMWGIISEEAVPCKHGVPCSTEYFEYFGFVNIPFLALAAFSIILILLLIGKSSSNKY